MSNSFKIGVVGGGQLCKMLIEANDNPNIKFNVLESDKSPSIVSDVAATVLRGSLHDPLKLKQLAEMSNILTYEIEDTDADTLLDIYQTTNIIPSPHTLKLIQNKREQKQFFIDNDIPTAKFISTQSKDQIEDYLAVNKNVKHVIKKCTGGYNGEGVMIVDNDVPDDLFDGECIIEEYIDCQKELAVMVAVDMFGGVVVYPSVESVFNAKNILEYQICPARVSKNIDKKAQDVAYDTIIKLNAVGVFAVEMFLDKDDSILVNEISPRPHNSGHHTIDAFNISQYQQLIKILTGKMVKEPQMHKESLMFNLLGPDKYIGKYYLHNKLENFDGIHINTYSKNISKPFRKLGHVTILGDSYDDLLNKYTYIVDKLLIKPLNLKPQVGVIMGSISDYGVMEDCVKMLKELGIIYEVDVVSAHRTPYLMFSYAKKAEAIGLKIIIAAAGGAAHLPGMTASITNLPVIGVPIKTSTLSGVDSLHSIVQMPAGVPVATMAINGAKNAALFAARILAINDNGIREALLDFKYGMEQQVHEMRTTISKFENN